MYGVLLAVISTLLYIEMNPGRQLEGEPLAIAGYRHVIARDIILRNPLEDNKFVVLKAAFVELQNKKIGGLTNDQLADLAQAYNRGDVISKSGNGLSDSGLKRIEDAVKSINIHVDAEGFITREEFERGMKKITKTKPRRL